MAPAGLANFRLLDTTDYATPYPEALSTMHRWVRWLTQPTRSTDGYIWLLQHASAITRGARTRHDEIFAPTSVPVYATERGGKATYHGPGQLVIYPVMRLDVLGVSLADYARMLVDISAKVCTAAGVACYADFDQMGVYTQHGKLASIGLRGRHGVATHGISINHALQPNGFAWIDPCGVRGGTVDQITAHKSISLRDLAMNWVETFRLMIKQ